MKSIIRLLVVAFVAGIAVPALGQTMTQRTTTTASGTIAVTNTFQTALALQSTRNNCTLQNQGTHTMYVHFGVLADATLAKAFQLAAGQAITCSNPGVVLTDAVNVTGTSGDAYVVTSQ